MRAQANRPRFGSIMVSAALWSIAVIVPAIGQTGAPGSPTSAPSDPSAVTAAEPVNAPATPPSVQVPTPAVSASCFLPPAKLGDDRIAAFLAAPQALLDQNSGGGLPLANDTRGLAGSSSAAVPVLVELAKSGTPAQQAAIGAGLARAAVACSRTNPDYAAMIQQAVAASGIAGMITAFVSASNEVQTAAIGGAAAGGAGGAGGAAGIGGGGAAGGGSAGQDGSVTVAQNGALNGVSNPGSYFAPEVVNEPAVSATAQ